MYRLIIVLFAIIANISLAFSNPKEDLHKIINLNSDWEFTSEIFDKYYPAKVPGSVHTDLFYNHLIPDPFTGINENSLQWIDTLVWVYKTEFKKPKNLNPDDQVEIVFKGLDTYADVFINDSLLFSANNMFKPWSFKIDASSLKNRNILKVKFYPTSIEENKQLQKADYKLPEGSRIYTRKAAYHYGWDWGPKYITAGIWQDVELHIWNTTKIGNVRYYVEEIDSLKAVVNFSVDIESVKDFFFGKIQAECSESAIMYSIEKLPIIKGQSTFSFKLTIEKPRLWWTHNLGEPFLYDFKIKLFKDQTILHQEKLKVGLRKVELVRESDGYGESFYFKLNNVPVFMKGANYIPQSSFPGDVSNNKYHQLIDDVVEANMNMLRVWGGGIYEKDIFYELCDSAGILVWQDFMFANSMYPDDSIFLQNIKQEAKYQVKRLSKHPSIALWCGNNEIDEAWHNWGWANGYSFQDSTEIWENYLNIFHEILPGVVSEISPVTSYISTSPLFGRGNPRSSFEGDNHYWYVWHDAYDFDWYNKVTGRFMSEFGFQSFPGKETINYFYPADDKKLDSDVIQAHQKHHRGSFLINDYMERYYPVPKGFDDFVYISQLLQAEGIRTGILAQRRAKPFCMGSLYWQLNDCWPAVSWSGIDYTGDWKALQYFVREDFKNMIIDPYLHNDTLDIYIVSDSMQNVSADLCVSVMDFYGQVKSKSIYPVTVGANKSTKIYSESLSVILNKSRENNHMVFCELEHNKRILDSRTVFFKKPKDLQLNKINIVYKIKEIDEGYELVLKSSVFIKNICLELPLKGEWSENYFDFLPKTEKRVVFKTKERIPVVAAALRFRSVNQIINNE